MNERCIINHDAILLVYFRQKPLDYFLHEQPVYSVSVDPLNDNIFASACDDGRLLIYDIREPASNGKYEIQ